MAAEEKKDEKKEEEKDPMESVTFPTGKEFSGGWVIEKTLDEGGFGKVYLVRNKSTKKVAALKAESNEMEGGSAIKLETLILKKLNAKGPTAHIPVLFASHKRTKFCYMVMTLLGENLKALRIKRPKERFSRGTWSRLGIQCLYALKFIHDCGFIHRDVKPQNFMMGHEEDKERTRIVHILDFGLARTWASYNTALKKWLPRKARGTAEFRGTLRYTSPNVHLRKEQGRADDVWSLIFVLIELNGGLPWQNTQKVEEVEGMKLLMGDKDVMLNMPPCMSGVLPHLRQLDYYQRPNYHLIFKALWQVMVSEGQTPSSRFDWESKDPDPSVAPADWEHPSGRFFKADPLEINAPPPANVLAEPTTNAPDMKSEKASVQQKKK